MFLNLSPVPKRQNNNTHHFISLLLACNKELAFAIYLEDGAGI